VNKVQAWAFSLVWLAVTVVAGMSLGDATLALWLMLASCSVLGLFLMTWAGTSFGWASLSYAVPAAVLLVGAITFAKWSRGIGAGLLMMTGVVWVAVTYWVFTRKGKGAAGAVDWGAVQDHLEQADKDEEMATEALTPVLPITRTGMSTWPGVFSGINTRTEWNDRWKH
jgi:hypothetical protein